MWATLSTPAALITSGSQLLREALSSLRVNFGPFLSSFRITSKKLWLPKTTADILSFWYYSNKFKYIIVSVMLCCVQKKISVTAY